MNFLKFILKKKSVLICVIQRKRERESEREKGGGRQGGKELKYMYLQSILHLSRKNSLLKVLGSTCIVLKRIWCWAGVQIYICLTLSFQLLPELFYNCSRSNKTVQSCIQFVKDIATKSQHNPFFDKTTLHISNYVLQTENYYQLKLLVNAEYMNPIFHLH